MQKGKTELNHPARARLALAAIGPSVPGQPLHVILFLIITEYPEQEIRNNFLGRSLRVPEVIWAMGESTVSHGQQQTPATFGLPLHPPPSRASPPNVPHQPAGRATEMTRTRTCGVPVPHRT
jgi:hypothetical protein